RDQGFDQGGVLGPIGEDPQLDLGIVGDDQLSARWSAKACSVFGGVGDLLKVRVRAAHPAPACTYLPEVRMQAPWSGAYVFQHPRCIRRECFLECAVFQKLLNGGMFLGQRLELPASGTLEHYSHTPQSFSDLRGAFQVYIRFAEQ